MESQKRFGLRTSKNKINETEDVQFDEHPLYLYKYAVDEKSNLDQLSEHGWINIDFVNSFLKNLFADTFVSHKLISVPFTQLFER